jgi:hypothetical protein
MNKAAQIFAFTALLSVLVASVAYAFNYDQKTDIATQMIMNVPYFYVDNNISEVDSSGDKGTHSNFTAQQHSPDSTYDTLTEIALADNEYSIDLAGGYVTASTADLSISQGTISFWIQFDSTATGRPVGQNTDLEIRLSSNAIVFDWGGDSLMTSANTFTTGTWYFMAFTWDENANDLFYYVGDENSAPTQDSNSQDGTYTGTVSTLGQATVYWGNGYGANQPVDGHMDDIRFYNTVKTLSEISADYNQTLNGNESGLVNYYQLNNDYTDSAGTDNVSLFGSGAFSTDIPSWNAGGFELDLEVQWTNLDYSETNEELCIYLSDYTHGSLDATGGYMIVGDGSPDWGSSAGTISFWVKMDLSVQGRLYGQHGDMEVRWSGSNLVLDWSGAGSMTSATSFSANVWYFVAIVWDEASDDLFLYVGDDTNAPTSDANSLNGTWTGTTPLPTENRFLNGLGGDEPVDGHGCDLRYYNIARSMVEIQSDYNVTLSGSETNLRSYFRLNNNFDDIGPDNNDGSAYVSYSLSTDTPFNNPASESIGVDVWTGSEWQNIIANLGNGWNNVSIKSYLTSSTLTIRYKGNTETRDSTQDSWNIDTAVIHAYDGESPPEVARVQHAEGVFDLDGTSPQVSFGAVPMEGNLLIVISGHRTGTPDTQNTPTITETGWTRHYVEVNPLVTTTNRRTVAIFSKIAGSSESSTITIDWADEPTGQGFVILQEFTGADNYSYVDVDGNPGTNIEVTTLDVPSSALSAGGNDNILAIAGIVWRDDGDAITGVSYDNLSDAVEVTAYSGLKGGSAFAYTTQSVTNWQTTVSWTTSRMASGLLIMFSCE